MLSSIRRLALATSSWLPKPSLFRTSTLLASSQTWRHASSSDQGSFLSSMAAVGALASMWLVSDDTPVFCEENEIMTKDNFLIFSGNSNPELGKDVSNVLDIPLGKIKIKKFPDGETFIQVLENVREKTVFVVQPTCNNDNIIELLLLSSTMKRASATQVVSIIPYFAYSRQDMMEGKREPVAAADIARMLEVMGTDHVVSVDLHSGQIEGFFNIPVDNLRAWMLGAQHFAANLPDKVADPNEKWVVVAGHENQMGRAKEFRNCFTRQRDVLLEERVMKGEIPSEAFEEKKQEEEEGRHVPLVLAAKFKTEGELERRIIGEVEGANCIVVDDIINSGNTLIGAVDALKMSGAKSVYAFVTHARFQENTMQNLDACEGLEALITTNTLPISEEVKSSSKVHVLSIADLLAEVIRRVILGDSLRSVEDKMLYRRKN